jgi:flavin-dependent dehydrogenase
MTALRLATAGVRVALLEEKHTFRGKVCGEFITPEAFPNLERAGVMGAVMGAGARKLNRLVLCALNGRRVEAGISTVSNAGEWALSLSRNRLDAILFDHARKAGADCIRRVAVKRADHTDKQRTNVEGMSLATGKTLAFRGDIVVDASGRNSRLAGRLKPSALGRGDRLYAMKAHVSGIHGIEGAVALFFFPGGYGGISEIEDGLANVCFIAGEGLIRSQGGNGDAVLTKTMMVNPAARDWLSGARVAEGWLTVGPLSFGQRHPQSDGLLAVGDAGGMNDPFTGTGIMMALRGGEIAADAILESLGPAGSGQRVPGPDSLKRAVASYRKRYAAEVARPMAMAARLRQAAFSPRIANLLAAVFTKVPGAATWVLKRTRASALNGTFDQDRRVLE